MVPKNHKTSKSKT